MGTTHFPCGCLVSRSIFGDRNIIGTSLCLEHAAQLKKEFDAVFKAILTTQQEARAEKEPRSNEINPERC